MGTCAATKQQHQMNNLVKTQLDQPQITSGTLSFKVLLKNIKLTIPQQRQCQIQFHIMNRVYNSPSHISIDCIHFWRASYETMIEISEKDMKQQSVKIVVLSQQKEVGVSSINLFEAAVGPCHFDFPIKNNQSKNIGRVQFDLKLCQIIQATIESSLINVEMNSSISDVAYNYNIRLVTTQLSFVSEHSETFINPNFRMRGGQPTKSAIISRKSLMDSQNSLNEGQTPISKKPPGYVAELHTIEWDHAEEQEKRIKLIVDLPITELLNSAIQVCIWSVKHLPKSGSGSGSGSNKSIQKTQKIKNNYSKHDSEYFDLEIQDHLLVAETYISLAHLYDNLQVELGDQKFIKLTSAYPKQLWYHGVNVGSIQYNLNVNVPHYLQQTTLGCQTENGILQQLQIVGQLDQVSIQEIQQIHQEYQKLTSTIFKLENKKLQVKDKLQARYEAELSLAKLDKLLVLTHSDTVSTFIYKSDEDLHKAQDLFIQLANHLIEYMETLESISPEQLYKNLTKILQRGELMLSQIGFFKDLNKKQLIQKQEICVKYQSFLINTLRVILSRINQKDPQKDSKIFITKYIVFAYFRLPQFRVKVLESIVNKDDPPLSETRGTEFIQSEDPTNIDQSTKQNIQVFDWQNYFHVYIQEHSQSISNQAILNQILADDNWKESMRHRSLNFCNFVEEWFKYVRNILHQKLIPWQDIPGYRTLTKAFICELKLQQSFNDAMKNALKSLMQNPTLLSIIVTILYNKTNLYNPDNVVETLELLDLCFSTLSAMPPYFDFPFFFNGLKQILIDSEHALSLAKCVWFIYNQYGLFPLEFKKDICDFIIEKVGIKLYLHWSKTVRTVYQNLLVYRVYHNHKNPKTSQQDEQQLIQQYAVMARPKKQQSYFDNRQQQNQLISDYIYVIYVRFIAKMEKIKQQKTITYIPEPQTYYQKMLLKKEKFVGIIKQLSQDSDEGKKKQSSPVYLKPIVLEMDEIKQEPSKPLIIPRPIMHKHLSYKGQSEADQSQLKYTQLAHKEFEQTMKNYNNWRQTKMKMVLSNNKLTEEEKSVIHLTFEVPKLDVMKKFDEREGI